MMPILDIKHVTTYRYNRPVSFGEHRMMLLPRDDDDQKVLECEIDIRPKPVRLDWSRDIFGNHVATAKFNDRADKLSFVSKVRLDYAPVKFHASDIDYSARRYPFAYSVDEWAALNRYIEPPAARRELDRWSAAFLQSGKSTHLHEFLVSMTQTIKRTIEHVSRHEEGIQDPVQTLALKSGSCRDVAVLMIAAVRSRGIAARFVSGYVHLVDDDEDKVVKEDDIAGGQHPCLGPGLRTWSRVGRFRPSRRRNRESKSHPRCRRAAPGRSEPAARHVVRTPVGPFVHECRSESKSG